MKLFKHKLFLAVIGIVIAILSFGQNSDNFSRSKIIERLRQDILFLASGALEGRESGTIGERLAADYLIQRMKAIGLEPLFDGSFVQEFPFMGRVMLGEKNSLSLGNEKFEIDTDFRVLGQSGLGTATAKGIYIGHGIDGEFGFADYENLTDLKGKIVFMEYFSPAGFDESKGMRSWDALTYRTNTAIKKGAEAVILVNTNENLTDPTITLRSRRGAVEIPIVYASRHVFDTFKANPEGQITISTDLYQDELTGLNVAGYLNNNAETTVVIGGHFDHLGFGGPSSRSPGEVKIHYGADDNASGTAGVLEAALFLKESNLKQNNYIFLAFGAEEKGLIGSRFFVDSDAYDIEKVNYMFNYDMIGRVDEGKLSLIGTGSSPTWNEVIDAVDHGTLLVTKSPGALGGSDHSSFYGKQIPVLFFFSGIHEDYHRPTDTPDKINYEGMVETLELSYRLMASLDGKDRLAHTPSGASPRGTRRAEGVSLGLMPDHAYTGTGLKIFAVIDDRPAKRAGLMNGDVIVKLNNTTIEDIQTYMLVLGELRAGTTTSVEVVRGDELLKFEIKL